MKRIGFIIIVIAGFAISGIIIFWDKIKAFFSNKTINPSITASQPVYTLSSGVSSIVSKSYPTYPIIYNDGITAGLTGSILLEVGANGLLTGSKIFVNDIGNEIPTPVSYIISQSITIAPVSTTEESTVGGTESSFAITNLMQFKNIEIVKTSMAGTVSITHDNGYVRNLVALNESWIHSSDDTQYFIISVAVTGGATYEYTGALN